MPHITQISAMDMESGSIFNQYVIPKFPISTAAQQVTGIVWNGTAMTVRGIQVLPVPLKTALQSFCEWLTKRQNAFFQAHNGRKFDFPVLASAFIAVDKIEEFLKCTAGLIDLLPLFTKVLPEQASYKQEDLVSNLLHTTYRAHNATEDVSVFSKTACVHKFEK